MVIKIHKLGSNWLFSMSLFTTLCLGLIGGQSQAIEKCETLFGKISDSYDVLDSEISRTDRFESVVDVFYNESHRLTDQDITIIRDLVYQDQLSSKVLAELRNRKMLGSNPISSSDKEIHHKLLLLLELKFNEPNSWKKYFERVSDRGAFLFVHFNAEIVSFIRRMSQNQLHETLGLVGDVYRSASKTPGQVAINGIMRDSEAEGKRILDFYAAVLMSQLGSFELNQLADKTVDKNGSLPEDVVAPLLDQYFERSNKIFAREGVPMKFEVLKAIAVSLHSFVDWSEVSELYFYGSKAVGKDIKGQSDVDTMFRYLASRAMFGAKAFKFDAYQQTQRLNEVLIRLKNQEVSAVSTHQYQPNKLDLLKRVQFFYLVLEEDSFEIHLQDFRNLVSFGEKVPESVIVFKYE